MEALLFIALWAGVIFLMMRFGRGAHVMGRGQGENQPRAGSGAETSGLRWIPPKRDVDPVCGTTVATGDAKSSVYDGHVYYFCSRDCREIFEATPGTYIGVEIGRGDPQLEHSHV